MRVKLKSRFAAVSPLAHAWSQLLRRMVLELRHVLWLTLALMWMLMVLEPRHRMWLVLALA